MAITDSFVLPADVVVVPVEELPARVREDLAFADGDRAITRPRLRTPSRIIDADAALLLEEFRSPKTIVDAVVRFSRAKGVDAEQTLTDALPMLQRFIGERFLVVPGADAERIEPAFHEGDDLDGFRVLKNVQIIEDTELYHVECPDGRQAALKIARTGHEQALSATFEREAAILAHLEGKVSPRLLARGALLARPYLAIEWFSGVNALRAADDVRRQGGRGRALLVRLCAAIADAYVHLHGRGVLHSDVHPRNVLVGADGVVKLIDYGLSRTFDREGELSRARRGGIGYFFEPEYARARRAGQKAPDSTPAGEQYGVAALLYYLVTGSHYLDFSPEQGEMFRQIAEDRPLPFARRRVEPWTDLEAVLARALAKEPGERFPSLAGFAAALRAVEPAESEPDAAQALAGAPSSEAASELLQRVVHRVSLAGPLLPGGVRIPPTCSVNYGAAGIAYALYRMSCTAAQPSLLSLADIWATKAAAGTGSASAWYNDDLGIKAEIVGDVSLYHTMSGVSLVQASIAHALGDSVARHEALEAFVSASRAPCKNLDLTLGRAGSLLGCALLLDAMPKSDVLLALGRELACATSDELNGYPEIERCRSLPFLGVAHGWAGVLYALLQWCRASGDAIPAALPGRLEQLAACATRVGDGLLWKRRIDEHEHRHTADFSASWCNGAAGFVHLWTTAHGLLLAPEYLAFARGAAATAWSGNAMGADLCCGAAGRAYALLALYRHTREDAWLERAKALAMSAVEGARELKGRGDSLYKGQLGVALLMSDLAAPESACMPLFEPEGWPPSANRSRAAAQE